MGVAGLWEVLRPAGQVRSLTELAVEDGFNANHHRGFRIGIDASIWFFHAAYGREGENPELRTLFFRCCRLLQLPLLPLFVFDGPHRPAVKRGKRVGGNAHWLTQGMKNIIDAFGFEWRIAPGEAEAELAYLNRTGVIDAVLSDDVDSFLFGATMVIRNPSNTLSGNRAHPVMNAQGKDDGNHVVTYTSLAILSDPSVALSREGAILIGLLSGGDYIPAGLPGCGQKFATGLARAGFGDSLVKAAKELKGLRLDEFLDQWRRDVKNELKTNKSGLLPSKKPSLAASLPDDFPSLPVLMSYADPITSENTHQKGNYSASPGVWRNDPDPMKIASLCELYFEWGVKDIIVHRFRTVLWPGIVCRAIRRDAMGGDHTQNGDNDCPPSPTKKIAASLVTLQLSSPSKKSQSTPTSDPSISEPFMLSSLVQLASLGSPSPSASPSSSSISGPSPLLLEVLSQRTHVSTDSTLEYRVLVDPSPLVERAESGVKGLRPPLVGGLFGIDTEEEDEGPDESGGDHDDEAGGVERLETTARAASKSGTKKRKARKKDPMTPFRLWVPACMIRAATPALADAYEEKVQIRERLKAKRGARGGRGGRATTGSRTAKTKAQNGAVAGDDDRETIPGPSTVKKAGTKTKGKITGIGGGRRRKPKQVSEAQDEAYEYIDLSGGEGPCSSDGEDAEEPIKGKGKATMTRAGVTKGTSKAKTSATNMKAATGGKMNDFYKTAKPSAVRPTKSTTSASQLPGIKKSIPRFTSSGRIDAEEEEDSMALAPPLPKSTRPLDLLRAKSRSNPPTSVVSKPKSSVPRCEGESSSSPSPRPSQTKLPSVKKPLYVDVSDSDVEVSDVRGPLSGATSTTAACDGGRDNETNKVLMTKSRQGPGRAVEGVIDLTANANAKGTKNISTSTRTTSPARERVFSPPPSIPSTSRSPSKLAHILLPSAGFESGEEKGSEGDELPTFHCDPSKPRTKTPANVRRPIPRPFPMQLVSAVSPISRRAGQHKSRQDGELDNDDTVEFVDVFMTPRGPSPPQSPSPSPSPVKPAALEPVKFDQSKRFPASPTLSGVSQTGAKSCKTMNQHRCPSVDQDVRATESEDNALCKSPRRSAVHSSPRHQCPKHDRAASPTPMRPISLAKGTLWMDAADDDMMRKPRASEASTIYISSDSDEGNVGPVNDGEEVDDDKYADEDMDGWADKGMILSVPPSPALITPPAKDIPLHPNPTRTSKFKPAVAVGSKVGMRASPVEFLASEPKTSSTRAVVVSSVTCHAPLVVARSKNKEMGDVIDLTSD